MLLINSKGKTPTNLEQAKIEAIDNIKGRVSLYMKNGLITQGTYLYDVKELSVGMTVLVGKVDNSYIILNKVANAPRENKSYTMIQDDFSTARKTYLLLRFQGEDGATSWIDNGQGLIPDYNDPGMVIDTDEYYVGVSSLLVPNDDTSDERAIYTIPNVVASNFECIVTFKYDNAIGGHLYPFNIYKGGGDADVRIRINDGVGWMYLDDSGGNHIFGNVLNEWGVSEGCIGSVTPNEWITYRLKMLGRKISFYINNALFQEWTATIDNPIDINKLWWGNWATSGHKMWLGYVKIFSPSET